MRSCYFLCLSLYAFHWASLDVAFRLSPYTCVPLKNQLRPFSMKQPWLVKWSLKYWNTSQSRALLYVFGPLQAAYLSMFLSSCCFHRSRAVSACLQIPTPMVILSPDGEPSVTNSFISEEHDICEMLYNDIFYVVKTKSLCYKQKLKKICFQSRIFLYLALFL